MPIKRSNSHVDMASSGTDLPQDPPRLPERFLQRFPELREYDAQLQNYYFDLTTVIMGLQRELDMRLKKLEGTV